MARKDWNKMNNRDKVAVFDFMGIPHGLKSRAAPAQRRDLEGPVLAAIRDLLSVHPKVLIAFRQNSGGASYQHSSGDYKPIMFYECLTSQRKQITITDTWGFLKDGRPFAIEAKRPDWKEPKDDREFRQALFISLIQNIGGVGGFARSVEEAAEILDA